MFFDSVPDTELNPNEIVPAVRIRQLKEENKKLTRENKELKARLEVSHEDFEKVVHLLGEMGKLAEDCINFLPYSVETGAIITRAAKLGIHWDYRNNWNFRNKLHSLVTEEDKKEAEC